MQWYHKPCQNLSLLLVLVRLALNLLAFYRDMGVDVTVVEAMDRILNAEDAEISAMAHKAFEKRGMKILTSAKLQKLEKSKEVVTATIDV